MITRAVPKPTSSKKREGLLIHVDGDYDQLKQFWNILNASPLKVQLRSERARLDASLDEAKQTFHVVLLPAIRYEPAIIIPRPEYPGYVYLVLGLETGRLKIGETDDMQRRLGELRREFGETFKRLHVIHTRDRFAKEKEIQAKLTEWGLHLEREFFHVPEPIEQWFISQPNEF